MLYHMNNLEIYLAKLGSHKTLQLTRKLKKIHQLNPAPSSTTLNRLTQPMYVDVYHMNNHLTT